MTNDLKKVYLIDVYARESRAMEIPDELDEFYKLIHCDTIDIVRRNINGKPYNIICDDNGLFAEDPKISAINGNLEAMLVGNLLVTQYDAEGEMVSLNDDAIRWLENNTVVLRTRNYADPYPMLYPVEYC